MNLKLGRKLQLGGRNKHNYPQYCNMFECCYIRAHSTCTRHCQRNLSRHCSNSDLVGTLVYLLMLLLSDFLLSGQRWLEQQWLEQR